MYQENCNEDIVEPETEVKTKKKKKKVRDSKEESSESFSDSTAIPHVKLVIKKSPVKPKDVKVMINDDSSKTSIPSIPTQDSDKQNGQSGKSDLKVETPTTEHKPSTKSPRKVGLEYNKNIMWNHHCKTS